MDYVESWESFVHRTAPALTVWIYQSALGAAAGEVRLRNLTQRNALQLHEAITVSWMHGSHQPRIRHLRHAKSAATARGSVLGGLVDLLVRTGIAVLAERLRGTGVDRTFLEDLEAQVHPEGSVLLVLSSDADLDRVRSVIERGFARGEVILMHAQLAHDAAETLGTAVRELQGATNDKRPDR